MTRILVLLLLAGWPALAQGASAQSARAPNFLVFFCDNLGYGDIGAYGSKLHRTPNLDRLATESRKFTHFYTCANVCTPSRVGLMTGNYARRLNLFQNVRNGPVLQPGESIGLNPSEVTMAEVLKTAGYRTMLIGKWHLGDQAPFLPTRQGFDEYWGIPYSDDMDPREGQKWPPLPLMRNEVVIDAPVDRNTLTQRETTEAVRFITANREKPFLLIISHAMPGSTRAPFSSPAFRGKSRNGPYGDSVEELDWSAGEVLGAVKRLGLEENTVVVWTSDNPATRRDPEQGSNAPLSGNMGTPAEGGMRVPFLVRWPGRVPAGTVCEELGTMMDLLPTFAQLAGATAPAPNLIDGKDIWPLIAGEKNAKTPHEAFYYYQFEQLQAVRSGPWKLFVPLEFQRFQSAQPPKRVGSPARLYNVVEDQGESRDVAAAHPAVVKRLLALAEKGRADIGDLNLRGRGERPAGWLFQAEMQRLPAAP
ncbi:MAG: Arylsulfatase [Verrucomicrobiota bacterium]|jgi:arylsulfatase A-like enzyme